MNLILDTLCFEGVEKIAHKFLHPDDADDEAERRAARLDPDIDVLELEREQVKGAIRTDFVLSAEIIVISLGSVADKDFVTRLSVLTGIALIMTVGVYGLVAGIVKLDDAGLYLSRLPGAHAFARVRRGLGRGLLSFAPKLMKVLSVGGTVAMFLVGGGIVSHGIGPLHHAIEAAQHSVAHIPLLSPVLGAILQTLAGLVVGAIVLACFTLVQRIRKPRDQGKH